MYILKDTYGSLLTIITGGARGTDTIIKDFCVTYGIKYYVYPPKFDKGYSVGEYFKRNDRIVSDTDFGIVFWDGVSKGTKYTIDKYKEVGKKCEIILLSNNTLEKFTSPTITSDINIDEEIQMVRDIDRLEGMGL